jgi:hypothetical protein
VAWEDVREDTACACQHEILQNASRNVYHLLPFRSIPLGTHAALLFTFVIYLVLFIVTGLTCNRTLLYNDCQFMTDLSVNGWVVLVGTLLTCWCASCSCLIGASRILQAVLDDVGGKGRFFRCVSEYRQNSVQLCYVRAFTQGLLLKGEDSPSTWAVQLSRPCALAGRPVQ